MNTIYELNTTNEVRDSLIDTKVKQTSPVVEVFSLLTSGKSTSHMDGKIVDKSVEHIKELASQAIAGDGRAVSEINAIRRFSIAPKLLEAIKILDFMGKYRTIPYDTVPMIRTYKYEGIDSRFQASSGDVPFAALSWREYPIATQTISSGFAVNYRELESGNFDGTEAEGLQQVRTDMQNKAVYYVISQLYNGIKAVKTAGTRVAHFSEAQGISKQAVDDMLKSMRRYGKVNIMGDYSVVSQLNGFTGYTTISGTTIPFGADAVAEEIRRTGAINLYNGAWVTEIPNALNFTKVNAGVTDYETYLPEGLLWFVPQGTIAPLQIFRRGGLSSMSADDIVTREHLVRFDMEIGAGLAEGLEDWIGLVSDSNYDVPTV